MRPADIGTAALEIKRVDPASGAIEGYGAVFGNIDHQGDVIESGAFSDTLKARPEVPMLWQHKFDEPIGTFRAEQDRHGLHVRGALTLEAARAKEARALARDGAVRGLSIGFIATDWTMKGSTRHIKAVDLLEVSLVTFPANPAATITNVKNMSRAEVERYLKTCGFSRGQAAGLARNWSEHRSAQRAGDEGPGSCHGTAEMAGVAAKLADLRSILR